MGNGKSDWFHEMMPAEILVYGNVFDSRQMTDRQSVWNLAMLTKLSCSKRVWQSFFGLDVI